MNQMKIINWLVIGSLMLFLGMCCFGFGSSWYTAGLKSDFYKRNGIEITQWEVFCGVAPPDRILHIKE